MTHTDDKAEPRQVIDEIIVEIMTRDEMSFLPQRCANFHTALKAAGYVISRTDDKLAEPRREEIARAIYLAWMNDERWRRMDLATIAEGKPLAYFWADIAADAIAALSTRPAHGGKADALQDSAYIAGMQEGFRLGLDENNEGLATRITARDGYLASITRPAPAAEPQGEIEAIINADTRAWGEHLRITSYCHKKCLMPKLRAAITAREVKP